MFKKNFAKMAEFERGQTFFDKQATNIERTKGKYFIGMCNADFSDDVVVCFVLNTEKRMDKYKMACNFDENKFILEPGKLSFLTDYTAVMLAIPSYYRLEEILGDNNIELKEKAPDLLTRQIKNCIDWNHIIAKYHSVIKDSFKD